MKTHSRNNGRDGVRTQRRRKERREEEKKGSQLKEKENAEKGTRKKSA